MWLAGTPAELDAATRALAGAGRLAQRGRALSMAGAEAGRARLYLRLTITTTRQAARPARRTTTSDQGATVLPFPGRRIG
ncbi:hypothetical protein HCB18_04215 [Salinispora arenicola]|uniref:hypothetical protein n=1 Tax=Salinispora arenicola TaxID=168697 RepID=UPI001695078D|nr:hypothetical protein [Salinispora arenicola]NIL56237.1 hypothetical protein [Salinispora arenicola]